MACCFALGTEPLVFHSVTTKLVLKVYRTSAFPVKHHMIYVPMETTHVCMCALQFASQSLMCAARYHCFCNLCSCFYRRQAHSSSKSIGCKTLHG